MSFKNIVNDFYARDISRKVRSTLRTKKLNGEFVGRSAPYGYLKNPDDKHKFIIDKESSLIVNKIFDWALDGKTRRDIADELNKLKILPPGLYKKNNNISNYNLTNTTQCWNPDIVDRILRNRVYTGDLIQAKATRINYRIHKLVSLNSDEWIIIDNHHEPIISKDVFDKVQYILNTKKGYKNSNDILKGYLKCPNCNKLLTLRKSKKYKYYYCSSFVRNGTCTNHSIKEEKLNEIIISDIKLKYPNRKIDKLNDDIIDELIDYIYVYDKNNVKIVYKTSEI
jgi:hypothetical protein